MSDYVNLPIAFTRIGNRRAITRLQIERDPWVKEFFEQFRHCFEYAPNTDVMLFIEPEMKA